jgi:hypothetical protein
MKQTLIALTSLLVCTLIACKEKQNDKKETKTEAAVTNNLSSIEGNWETVSVEVNGRQTKPKKVPQQFKMFHDGFFSLITYDDSGEFSFACAGNYEISGSMYKETCTYNSSIGYIGSKDWQKWEMKGDTLIFYGFEKAEMADGKDVTAEWNGNGRFVEKRVRAKK